MMGYKFTSSACSQTLPFPELQRESYACDPHPPSPLPMQKEREPRGLGEEGQLSGEGPRSMLLEQLWNRDAIDERGF